MPRPDEAQRPIGALTNPNPRRYRYIEIRFVAPRANSKWTTVQANAIVFACDGKSLRQLGRPIGQAARSACPRPPGTHFGKAAHGLKRSNQNATGMPYAIRHDVEAFVHAVDEIHISTAGRSEQHFCSFGKTVRGMSGEITGAEVSFGFNDHPCRLIVLQDAAQQRGRELDGGPFEETD